MDFDCAVQGTITAASIFGGAATQIQSNIDTAIANLCVGNAWNVDASFCVFGQNGANANITDYCLAHNTAGQVLLNSSTSINARIMNVDKFTLTSNQCISAELADIYEGIVQKGSPQLTLEATGNNPGGATQYWKCQGARDAPLH